MTPGQEDGLPADGSEQSGACLVVEGDDDAGGREVRTINKQRTSGKQRQMIRKALEYKTELSTWDSGLPPENG